LFVGTQQDIRMPSANVTPLQTDQPKQTADISMPVHSQKTEVDSHSYKTTTTNTTTSPSIPLTGADSVKKEGKV